MISVFLPVLRHALWANKWPVLVTTPCVPEKNVNCWWGDLSMPCMASFASSLLFFGYEERTMGSEDTLCAGVGGARLVDDDLLARNHALG